MKEQFSIAEEGFDQIEEEEVENMMVAFIEYVKKNKVGYNTTPLTIKISTSGRERRRFGLHVQVESWGHGRQTSTFHIYWTVDWGNRWQGEVHLHHTRRTRFLLVFECTISLAYTILVAKFVSQRGRIALSDLQEYSNRLVSLEPAHD